MALVLFVIHLKGYYIQSSSTLILLFELISSFLRHVSLIWVRVGCFMGRISNTTLACKIEKTKRKNLKSHASRKLSDRFRCFEFKDVLKLTKTVKSGCSQPQNKTDRIVALWMLKEFSMNSMRSKNKKNFFFAHFIEKSSILLFIFLQFGNKEEALFFLL